MAHLEKKGGLYTEALQRARQVLRCKQAAIQKSTETIASIKEQVAQVPLTELDHRAARALGIKPKALAPEQRCYGASDGPVPRYRLVGGYEIYLSGARVL